MLRLIKITLTTLSLILVVTCGAFGQQTSPAPSPKAEDNYVTEKGFKSEVFTVTYREVNNLGAVLRPLLSGFKGSTIMANGEFKTLTVRDFPENIATIQQAIKRLDLPSTPRPNIELHMHILVASNTGGTTSQLPAELKDVITQLRGTLSYQNYELAASVVQRLTETPRGLRGSGTAQIAGQAGMGSIALPYDYDISSVSVSQNSGGGGTIQIGQFAFATLSDKDRAKVETALNLRDGEKVVVGTATIRDRALIVVLTAKLLN
jgi:hypothetical protein